MEAYFLVHPAAMAQELEHPHSLPLKLDWVVQKWQYSERLYISVPVEHWLSLVKEISHGNFHQKVANSVVKDISFHYNSSSTSVSVAVLRDSDLSLFYTAFIDDTWQPSYRSTEPSVRSGLTRRHFFQCFHRALRAACHRHTSWYWGCETGWQVSCVVRTQTRGQWKDDAASSRQAAHDSMSPSLGNRMPLTSVQGQNCHLHHDK